MSLHPASSFRKAAIALAAVGVLGLAGPSNAQERVTNQGSPACAAVTDSARHAQCEINEAMRRTQNLERDTAQQSQQAADSSKETDCTRTMKTGLAKGNFTIDAVRAAYGARDPRNTSACEILQKLQKG